MPCRKRGIWLGGSGKGGSKGSKGSYWEPHEKRDLESNMENMHLSSGKGKLQVQ